MSFPPDFIYSMESGDKFIDVSHYQGVALTGHGSPISEDQGKIVMAMMAAKAAGAVAVGIKFTEGLLSKDPFAPYFAIACESIGLNWFPYHRFVSGSNQVIRGLTQAKLLYSAAYQDPRFTKAGPAVLDWENIGAEAVMHPYDAVAFLEYMGHHTLLNPILYSSKHFLDEQTVRVPGWGRQEWIMDYRLWVASYPQPLLPTSRPLLPQIYVDKGETPYLWQNVCDQPFSGLNGPVDQSVRL